MTIPWHRRKRISHSEYMADFRESSKPDSVSTESKIAKAYERAAKTREFEIGLYWKRAGYFWAFIASIYTAFFSVQKEFYYNKHAGFTHGALPLLVLSALGFFFCLAWLLSSYRNAPSMGKSIFLFTGNEFIKKLKTIFTRSNR